MRSHREHASVPEVSAPRLSSVHVLRSEDELREAVQRAAEFHKRTATLLRARSDQYQALLEIPVDHPVLD
jgi:hypothetical protein